MQVNKKRIRSRFARAAATYEQQAVIQQQVADNLLSLLTRHSSGPPKRVLEIGCSTGILTRKLVRQYPEIRRLFVNDLVPSFGSILLPSLPDSCNPVFLEGDIEALVIPGDLDLIISSSTFHWLEDLSGLLERLAERMQSNAVLAFSLYSTRNFHELRDISGIGLDYYSPVGLERLVGQYFSPLTFQEEQFTFYFDTPLQLLNHLRQTGVNALDAPAWTRSRLREFSEAYIARYACPKGVPLTYHPLYCLAQKK